MKYAFNSFVLEANIPVAIQGNDSLYTFQNITNNSITVLGSNNSTDWVSLCVVNAANAKTTNSAFKFLCINSGTLLVNRAAAGSSATTALVNESGNPLPVAQTASENHIGEVGGRTVRVAATFARPADTSAYAALDTVSTSTSAPVVITFSGMARINAGSGYITKARIMTDQKTNSARYRLHLFHTAPTLTNDNAAFPLLWADRANRVGKIDFSPMTTEDATNSTCAESLNEAVRLSFTCEAANTALYGILETLDAFTPASGQNFYISLTAEQN